MRKASFSIGSARFFPAIATVNTAGFFQGFRFHSTGTGDYRNELAKLAQVSYQRWENEGLDPIQFVQAINARKFYYEDGNKLLNFLHEYCWMMIRHSATEMDSADKAAITAYAYAVISEIEQARTCNAHHISYRGHDDEDELGRLATRGDEILASLIADKKEGTTTFKIMKTVHELFNYVMAMNKNDSTPEPNGPGRF